MARLVTPMPDPPAAEGVDVEAVARRWAATTAGQGATWTAGEYTSAPDRVEVTYDGGGLDGMLIDTCWYRNDAIAIAAAPTDIAALLTELQTLRARNEALVGAIAAVVKCSDQHHVIFDADHWTIEHSLACRASGDMAHCPYNNAISEVYDEPPDDADLGRWRITDLDDEGLPSLERDEGPDQLAAALASLAAALDATP